MSVDRIALRPDWYAREIEATLDLERPGIYEWRIEGAGVYVGKALRLKSRLSAYPNNVRRMLQGLPWHGDPTRSYRPIHHALRQAHDARTAVVVSVLEVCTSEARNEREQYWIWLRRQEAAAGGPKVLNAE